MQQFKQNPIESRSQTINCSFRIKRAQKIIMPSSPQPNIKLKKFLTNVGQKVANGNAKLLFLTPIIRAYK